MPYDIKESLQQMPARQELYKVLLSKCSLVNTVMAHFSA
ncbi:hypothetical protein PMAG_a6000 [Pseudoalteromonas mariniglutinosa NCIMB 1770]|nr:hypothetical protein [Pseudoalteromonas mariniglutinosa NCIMB 1770]